MKVFTQTENKINKLNKNFKKPTARGGAWKAILWALRPIHWAFSRLGQNLRKLDANIDAPEKSSIAFAADLRDDLADIQGSISEHAKTLGKLRKQRAKDQEKLKDASGKKRTKLLKRINESKQEIESIKRKIGRNQELHAKISKKLNKLGLLND